MPPAPKAPRIFAGALEARALDALDAFPLAPGDRWSGLSLSGAARGDARAARWDEIEARAARLGAVNWEGASWSDCRFESCDLSHLPGARLSVTRAEFDGCRARALECNASDWSDVTFRNCNLSGTNFRGSRWKRARFEGCDLGQSDWNGADARGLVFQNCDLRGADFNFCQLAGADWRTCQSEGVSLGAASLRGLIVEPVQAAQLARILGLDVRWE